MAGFRDFKFKQEVKSFDEQLLEYRFQYEAGGQKFSYRMVSDGDLFKPIFATLNLFLLRNGSNKRFYKLDQTPNRILIEKELAIEFMRKNQILFFLD